MARWLTLGVGKYFHDTNRGLGVLGDARYPAGAGDVRVTPLAHTLDGREMAAASSSYLRLRPLAVAASSTGGCSLWNLRLQPLAPTVAGLPPEADPSSWSNVSVQNRDLQQQQRRYGRHLQLFKGSVSRPTQVGR